MEVLASTSSTMLPPSAVLANEDHGVKATVKLLDYIIAICQNPYSQSLSLHDLPGLVKEVADYDEEYEALRKDKQRMGHELRKSRAECRQAHMRIAELEKLRQDKIATEENLWQESKSREESFKRAQEEVIILRKQLEKQGQYAADLAKEVEDYKLQASQAQLEHQAAQSSHAQEIAKMMEEKEVRTCQLTTIHEEEALVLRLERDGLKGRLYIVESELLGAEKRADSSIKTLEVKVEKLQAREQSLEQQLQKVMQDTDSFAQAYAEEKKELEAHASSLSDQYQRASQNLEVALQEGGSYRQQIDGLKEELGRRSSEDKEWELKLANIEQELRKKEDLTTSLKSETEAHLQERLAAEEKLNGTLTNLINKLKEKDARLANLHCELVSQQQGKASTEDQWKSKHGVIENQPREKDQLIKSLQSELSELSSRGNTLDDKVKGLEGNVSKLKTENKDLQQENHSLLVKVEEQAGLVRAKHNEMEALENAMKEMQTRLETALTEERQEKDRFILSLQAKEEELKALKSASTTKNNDLKSLENAMEEMQASLAALTEERQDFEQEKNRFIVSLQAKEEEVKALEKASAKKEEQIQYLQSEKSELSSRCVSMEGNVSKLEALQQENRNLAVKVQELEEQAGVIITTDNELKNLKNVMKEMEITMTKERQEAEQDKSRLILTFQAKDNELKALESASAKGVELQNELQQKEEKIRSLQSEKVGLSSRYATLEGNASMIEQQNNDLQKENRSLLVRVEEQAGLVMTKINEVETLDNAMKEMQITVTKERQEADQEKDRLVHSLQAKEEELKALKSASAETEEQVRLLQSEKSQLSSRCVSMEGNVSKLEAQINGLQEENGNLLTKMQDLEKQAGLVMAENNEFKTSENVMKEMEITMAKERQEFEQQKTQLVQEKNQLMISLQAKEDELKALQKASAEREDQTRHLQAEMLELSSRCASMEGNVSQLRTQNNDYEKENRSLLLKVEGQAGLVMAKNSKMEALENAMKKMEATMTKERQQAEQDKNQLIFSLKAKEEELKALKRESVKGVDLGNELRQKEEQKQSLQAEKSELSLRCVSMEGNVSKLEAQNSGLQKENDNLLMKVLSIEEEANLLMVKERQEYEQEKNRLRSSLQAKEEELKALERASVKRIELEEGLRQKEEQIKYLQSEKSKLSSRGVSMEDNVSKLEALNNDLQKENRDLLVKIQDLKEQVHEITNRLLQESQEAEERRNDSHQLVTRQEIAAIPRPLSRSSNASSELVFVLETGAWHIRAGWVHVDRLEALDVPTLVARPRNDKGDLWAIVQNAGLQASPMYMKFRDQGIFLCNDAWYCSFEHPDPVLRSALKLEGPLVRGRLERPIDLKLIWQDVLEKMEVDVSTAPIVVTYKPTTTPKERAKLVEILFESCEATRVRFLNEAFILSSVAKAATALVLDIGEDESRVVPVYEQLVVDVAIKTAPIGGADLTNYMADMLLSCRNETYSSMVTRRRLDLARKIKEKHAYVAKDFAKQTEIMGHFEREKVDVMKFVRDERSRVANDRLRDAKETRHTSAIPSPNSLVAYETSLQDGTEISFVVGRERFHCPELLFRPELHKEAKHKISIPDLVLQSLHSLEPDLWEELLQNVVIAGQTSLLPGFPERLTAELKSRLPPKFAKVLRVVTTEGVVVDDCLPLRSIPEGKNDGIEYNSAVWRGAATLSSRILEENCWLDHEVYTEKGPSAIEDPTYSGSI